MGRTIPSQGLDGVYRRLSIQTNGKKSRKIPVALGKPENNQKKRRTIRKNRRATIKTAIASKKWI
jgi:hypothetical protein